jgi:hypothetical protein
MIVFHGLSSGPSSDLYIYPIDSFTAVLDAVVASGLEIVTVDEGVRRIRCN